MMEKDGFNLALFALSLFILILLPVGSAEARDSLSWLTYQEAESLRVISGKYVLIDIYKATCGWCRKMQRTTYADSAVIGLLKESFLPVRVDLLSGRKLKVNGVELRERDIARALKVRGTPTTIFMDSTGKVVVKVPGYIPPQQFVYLLRYISGGWYKDLTFDEYYESEKILERERSRKK